MFRYLLLTICVAFIPIVQGRNIAPASRWVEPPPPVFSGAVEPNVEDSVYVPYSEESIRNCHGMPCDQYKRMQEKLEMIMDIQAELQATQAGEWIGPDGIQREMPAENGTLDGCIWLTEEQAELMLEDVVTKMEERMHGRKKRTLDRNIPFGWNRWDVTQPIKWKFDNKHSESERQIIRDAFQHWEEHTCIRFQEIPFEQTERGNHLMITKEATGCHSYVGRTSFIPQVINLQASCLWQFGIPVHEIGHALGMWHEQQRHDRDDNIRILYENLGSYVSQFTKLSTVDYGVPYDPQSVMHYSPKDGSSNGQRTMEHLDPLFTQSFGQRTGLSFYNAKIINAAYCARTCDGSPLRQPCQRGGYQDPRDCSRCRCPDGWTGSYCERLADSKIDSCGGDLLASPYSEQEILSPGYRSRRYYQDQTECNWHIKAPQGYKVELRFEGHFGVYCHYHQQCFHWVEVRRNGNMGEPGPRFCCYTTPQAVLASDGDEMLVLMRANFSTPWSSARRGFKALYKAVRTTNVNGDPQTPPPTTRRTTTTTTPATRPTQRPSGGPLFSCSFENHWCNTRQDLRDDFDWKMTNRATPSSPTGPSYAYSGRYYLFIEASNPRRRGDEATLLLPNLHYRGTACLRFRYHMYGFHIGSLRAFIGTGGAQRQDVFKEVGEKGNVWLPAQINVQLNYNSELGFTGVRGNEYSGDIGLDDVTVTAGSC